MFAAIALAAGLTASPDAADLSWLSGYWLECAGGRETSETWSDVRAGQLIGVGVVVRGGRVQWEFVRIGPSGGGIAFFAQPSGQPAAEFPAVEVGERRVVFENAAHDFPQRVIYSRDGDRLTGRIEGAVDGQPRSVEWVYTAAALNARCPDATP
jgi:hypothetical protein